MNNNITRAILTAFLLSTAVLSFWGLYQTVNYISSLKSVIQSEQFDNGSRLVNNF